MPIDRLMARCDPRNRRCAWWRRVRAGSTVVMLLHARAAFAQSRVPEVTLVAATTIDGERADLVPVDAIAVAPNGTIALTQRQDYSIRFFGPNGAPLGSAGRRGSGPGEFLSLSGAGWNTDSLWTWDSRLRRLTLFSVDGKVVRNLTVVGFVRGKGPEPENIPGRVLAVYPDGRLLVDGLARRNAAGGVGSPQDRVALIASDSGLVERIVAIVPPDPVTLALQTPNGLSEWTVPFVTRPVLTSSPDGTLIGVVWLDPLEPTPQFHAKVVDASGRVVYDRAYTYDRVAISREAIDSAINTRLRRITGEDLRGTVRNELRKRIPTNFPAFTSAILATDGRLWIELRPTARKRPWLVLSKTGHPEFQATVPSDVTLRLAAPDGVWGVRHLSSGELAVVQFQLPARR